jgi:hypothetical protein
MKQWKNKKELENLNWKLQEVEDDALTYFSSLKSKEKESTLNYKAFIGKEINLKNIFIILGTYQKALSYGNRFDNSSAFSSQSLPCICSDFIPLLIPRFIGDMIMIQVVESISSSLFNLFLNLNETTVDISSGFNCVHYYHFIFCIGYELYFIATCLELFVNTYIETVNNGRKIQSSNYSNYFSDFNFQEKDGELKNNTSLKSSKSLNSGNNSNIRFNPLVLSDHQILTTSTETLPLFSLLYQLSNFFIIEPSLLFEEKTRRKYCPDISSILLFSNNFINCLFLLLLI